MEQRNLVPDRQSSAELILSRDVLRHRQSCRRPKDEIRQGRQDSHDSHDSYANCSLAQAHCSGWLQRIVESELWLTRLTSDMQQSQESGGADSPEYSLRPAKLIHTLLSFTAISFKVFNKNMSRKLLNNSPFDVGTTICILHFTWIS